MKCPYCKEEIEFVRIYSQCTQNGTLEGTDVVEYDHPDVLNTEEIECPKCTGSLLGIVFE
jgi:hypothetical protein